MKILFAHEVFGAWGGAESILMDAAGGLRERGHEFALVHGAPTGRGEEPWRDMFPVRIRASGAASARELVREFDPDLVFLHSSPGLDTFEALATTGRPTARMVHDHRLFCLRGCRYSPWTRRPCRRALSAACVFPCGGFLRRGLTSRWTVDFKGYQERKRELELTRGAALSIVASQYMRDELVRNGFWPTRVEVHPPVHRRPPPATPASPTGNRLVFAGQIVRGKGVDVLLESLARVRSPFECVIVGDGSHRRRCEKLCRRLRLADRVRFTGYVPFAEVETHYANAAVALFSSVWPEPFGLAGVEALRHGVPVVAFDVGGVREWLDDGESGFVAPWMDRDGFAQRVDRLLGDRALAARMGARGRELMLGRYDFERYMDRMDASLRSAAVREWRAAV